ncbi:MAG: hypothetical protein HUJ51_03825, partial [Eggerthellaceae bacterium]|nr:hypothetical protein [Eggerthellaceae bacterium]
VDGGADYEDVPAASRIVTIDKVDISDLPDSAFGQIAEHVYDKTQYRPNPSVTYGGKDLVENVDIVYTWGENIHVSPIEAKKNSVTIAAVDSSNFTGSRTIESPIRPATITVSAKAQSAQVGESAPKLSALDYTVDGLILDDSWIIEPTIQYKTTPPDPLITSGLEYTIEVKDGNAGNDYSPEYVDNKLIVEKGEPKVTPPSANTLTYNGQNQTLITMQGEATGGTIQYVVDPDLSADPSTWDWTNNLPAKREVKMKGAEVADYDIYYRVKGDENHIDLFNKETMKLSVPILQREVTMKALDWSGTVSQSSTFVPGVTKPEYNNQFTLINSIDGDDYSNAILPTITWPEGVYDINNGMFVKASPAGHPFTIQISGGSTGSNNYKIVGYENGKLNIAKGQARVEEAPTGMDGLIYNGTDQPLLNMPGTAYGGDIYYRFKGKGENAWRTDLPTGNNAGDYNIEYYVKGDSDHKDSRVYELNTVKILEKKPEPTSSDSMFSEPMPTPWSNPAPAECDGANSGDIMTSTGDSRLAGVLAFSVLGACLVALALVLRRRHKNY